MATLVEIAAQLVAAHAANSKLTTDELLLEIGKVHAALKVLESGEPFEEAPGTRPAMTVKEAFKKNEIACLICGKGGFKTLTRHLHTAHDMKPAAYKKQFGIPSKQALSAKSYSESRKQMALDRGLGVNLAKARKVRMAKIEAKKAAISEAASTKSASTKAATGSANPAKTKPSPKAKVIA